MTENVEDLLAQPGDEPQKWIPKWLIPIVHMTKSFLILIVAGMESKMKGGHD